MSFAGQVVFITGGGSGMGRLAAQRMADAGAKVAAVDINEAGLAETAEGREGIHTWRLDVTDNQAVLGTVKEVEDRLGPIDRVYAAAALLPSGRLIEQALAERSTEGWTTVGSGGVVRNPKPSFLYGLFF